MLSWDTQIEESFCFLFLNLTLVFLYFYLYPDSSRLYLCIVFFPKHYHFSVFAKLEHCACEPLQWVTMHASWVRQSHAALSLWLWIPCLETHSLNCIGPMLLPYPVWFHLESGAQQQRNYQKPFHNVNFVCILNLQLGLNSPRGTGRGGKKETFSFTHTKKSQSSYIHRTKPHFRYLKIMCVHMFV